MARPLYIAILMKSWKGIELVSSRQHWAKNILEMFVIEHTSIWPNFSLIVIRIQKNKHKFNFHYLAISMMTPQILKSVDFTKTQKSIYLENETFFLQIKKIINYTKTKCEICAKLTTKTSERWRDVVSLSFLLTLSRFHTFFDFE